MLSLFSFSSSWILFTNLLSLFSLSFWSDLGSGSYSESVWVVAFTCGCDTVFLLFLPTRIDNLCLGCSSRSCLLVLSSFWCESPAIVGILVDFSCVSWFFVVIIRPWISNVSSPDPAFKMALCSIRKGRPRIPSYELVLTIYRSVSKSKVIP